MTPLSPTELAKIPYIDPSAVHGRTTLLVPFWDGFNWRMWTETSTGQIIEMQIVAPVHSNYVARQRVDETDIWIQFVEQMWQFANWPEIAPLILGISDDFHCLATSVAKLRHFFDSRSNIDQTILTSFVRTELEYLLIVARTIFDLLQESLSTIWNNKIRLLDDALDARKRRHKLPSEFTKTVLEGRERPKTVDALIDRYALPQPLAQQYANLAPFYLTLLKARDRIVHGGKSIELIFVTEKGFCVSPDTKVFRDFPWEEAHRYNENVVSLLPWLSHVVFGTMTACNGLLATFLTNLERLPPVAPGFHIFIRDPSAKALLELDAIARNHDAWWTGKMQE